MQDPAPVAAAPADAVPSPQPAPAAFADDDQRWRVTLDTVQQVSTTHGWTASQATAVLDVLAWRHRQLIVHRDAMRAGTLSSEAGREALLHVANKARASVLLAVGAEQTEALHGALEASSLGAGL